MTRTKNLVNGKRVWTMLAAAVLGVGMFTMPAQAERKWDDHRDNDRKQYRTRDPDNTAHSPGGDEHRGECEHRPENRQRGLNQRRSQHGLQSQGHAEPLMQRPQ